MTPYEEIKARLYHGHRKVANNTHLKLWEDDDTEGVDMYLYGNLVAEFRPDYLRLDSAGWYTHTTKDRLNMALQMGHCLGHIYQEDWTWYHGKCHHAGIPFRDGMKFNYYGGAIR